MTSTEVWGSVKPLNPLMETSGTEKKSSSFWSGKTAPPMASLFSEDEQNHRWSFDDAFYAFALYGNHHGDGHTITLSKIDKWFKQAKIFSSPSITTADTAINFKLIARRNKRITQDEFYRFLDAFCRSKKICPVDIGTRLVNCGPPETHNCVVLSQLLVIVDLHLKLTLLFLQDSLKQNLLNRLIKVNQRFCDLLSHFCLDLNIIL